MLAAVTERTHCKAIVMKKFLSAVAIVVVLSGAAKAQDAGPGYTAYQEGDYATALREWIPLAEKGDAGTQVLVGMLYLDGVDGVPQDYTEAVR